eukprot:1184828-Prorocentrum_minimum.AAC.4
MPSYCAASKLSIPARCGTRRGARARAGEGVCVERGGGGGGAGGRARHVRPCEAKPGAGNSPPNEANSPPIEVNSPPNETNSRPNEANSPPNEANSPPNETNSPPNEANSPPIETNSTSQPEKGGAGDVLSMSITELKDFLQLEDMLSTSPAPPFSGCADRNETKRAGSR